jgi:hypothetical protein
VRRLWRRVSLVVCLVCIPILAQNLQNHPATVKATIDAQSAELIPKALAALNGTSTVTDVTLTGTATRTVGPDSETGTITMKAMGAWNSRVDLVTGAGTWTEVHSAVPPAAPSGYEVGPDGTTHQIVGHNMHTDAVWFFPAFSSLIKTTNPQLVVTDVGLEDKDGVNLEHLHFISQFPPLPEAVKAKLPKGYTPDPIEPLTAVEIYLDPSTDLPAVVSFNTHPDRSFLVNIPVEVHFSNYQSVSGVQIPFHVQKFLNGTLLYDVTIQSAVVNSGLKAADFTAQ